MLINDGLERQFTGGNHMPLVKISLRKGRSPEDKKAILDGVHAALVGAFLIPDSDRHQILHELDPECFDIPPQNSTQYTVIEIIAFKGRSFEAKKKLYAAIIDHLTRSPGIPRDDILIILQEPPTENWGIHGGRPANEVNVGFKIEV
jgi:phenylpyruvate tautomerase PptA (4-oxalocrotonate tautomerase family)